MVGTDLHYNSVLTGLIFIKVEQKLSGQFFIEPRMRLDRPFPASIFCADGEKPSDMNLYLEPFRNELNF
jgi:hypothetical protein